MSELVVLAGTWIFEISYRSGYVGLLVLHLLLLVIETLAHCQNVVRLSLFCRYYVGICLSKLTEQVPLPFLVGSPLVILIECMIFLSFLDVIRMFMSAAYFLTQSDFGILSLQSAFL